MQFVIVMVRIIFYINYHQLIKGFQLRKAFTNKSSVNIKLSQTQLSKMVQLGGSLFLNPFKFVRSLEESRDSELVKNKDFESGKGIPKYLLDTERNIVSKKLDKKSSSLTDSAITLINNKIEYILSIDKYKIHERN